MQDLTKQASFLDTLKAVLSAFAGVRRRAEAEKLSLNPVHLAVVAIAGVVVFIVALVTVVKIVTG